MKRLWVILVVLILLWLAVPRIEAQAGLHGMLRLWPHKFSDLAKADTMSGGSTPDGYMTYCSDCATPSSPGATCAGSGSGAEAHRIRGAWHCF